MDVEPGIRRGRVVVLEHDVVLAAEECRLGQGLVALRLGGRKWCPVREENRAGAERGRRGYGLERLAHRADPDVVIRRVDLVGEEREEAPGRSAARRPEEERIGLRARAAARRVAETAPLREERLGRATGVVAGRRSTRLALLGRLDTAVAA